MRVIKEYREEIKKLRKVPVRKAEASSAIVVNVPIGSLKLHDAHRALYIATSSFVELASKQRIIIEIIKKFEKDMKEMMEKADSMTKEEILNRVKELALEKVENPETHLQIDA